MEKVVKQLCTFLRVSPLKTSVYHPQINGLVERFNGTLKQMLHNVAMDKPKEWLKGYLPYCLWRERCFRQPLGFPFLS